MVQTAEETDSFSDMTHISKSGRLVIPYRIIKTLLFLKTKDKFLETNG